MRFHERRLPAVSPLKQDLHFTIAECVCPKQGYLQRAGVSALPPVFGGAPPGHAAPARVAAGPDGNRLLPGHGGRAEAGQPGGGGREVPGMVGALGPLLDPPALPPLPRQWRALAPQQALPAKIPRGAFRSRSPSLRHRMPGGREGSRVPGETPRRASLTPGPVVSISFVSFTSSVEFTARCRYNSRWR
jgi:hypothetical protein